MEITTERLVLRDFVTTDWEAMLRIESDPETVRYQSYAPRTADECRAYIERDLASREDRSCFDLAITKGGAMIGRVGLDVKKPERGVGELWFVVDRHEWGHGYGPEAAKAMMDYGFSLGLHRVFMECDPRNLGATRLAEKIGLEREGCLRRHWFLKGEWVDSLYFATLKAR